MRIRYQLYVLIGAISALTVTSVAVTLFNQGKAERTLHETELLQGATEHIVKVRLGNYAVDGAGLSLKELIEFNDRRINALIDGDAELGIPAAPEGEFRELMVQVLAEWQALKDQLEQPVVNTVTVIQDSENLYKILNKAVAIAKEASATNEQFVRVVNVFSVISQVILVVATVVIINRIVRLLTKTSGQIAGYSQETAASLAEQEKVLAQQAASVNQTTTTIEELGASSRQSAEQAEASSAGAKQALELATYGKETVSQTVEGIESLKGNVMAIADKIMQLSEQTTQVTTVSELVADIANQTNILALNAAVEAARAGEQGKGFAVVAQEVRKLADQSKKSAEKITTLIREVQGAMNSTVMVTDEGMKATNRCAELAHTTAETFATIANAIDAVYLNSQQIALSSKQQAVGVQQAISAMNAINLGAQETATSVSQVKAATQQLVEAAETLQNAI